MITFLFAKYILKEGCVHHPKKIITCYFSPVCAPCFEFKKTNMWRAFQKEKDTMIVYQTLLMDDHNIVLQVFILSLIKKFRMVDFWEMCNRFYKLEQDQSLTPIEIAQKMGFTEAEIHFMIKNPSYQKATEKELKSPVKAFLQNNKVIYKAVKDEDIDVLPQFAIYKKT